jgi:DNA-binding GntR family transcriptional regulator
MVRRAMRPDADEAYARLRASILNGDLHPNERLIEADLMQRLDAARAAVRTALVRLDQEGLVSREHNRGARVRRVGEHEAIEILQARAALEAMAAREAATRAEPQDIAELRAVLATMRERLAAGDLLGVSERNSVLHARILELSAHHTAARLVSSLRSQLVRYQYRTILLPGRAERSYREHGAIVEAIAAGDGERAAEAMRAHLEHVADALREAVRAQTAR